MSCSWKDVIYYKPKKKAKVTFKIDVDCHLNDEELDLFIQTRRAILESLGFKLLEHRYFQTERGMHFWFTAYGDEIDDRTKNLYQFLLGDDDHRFDINRRRLERGIPWNKANVLFSRILDRKENYDCTFELKTYKKYLEKIKGDKHRFINYAIRVMLDEN